MWSQKQNFHPPKCLSKVKLSRGPDFFLVAEKFCQELARLMKYDKTVTGGAAAFFVCSLIPDP
jgi:hypothetical protein